MPDTLTKAEIAEWLKIQGKDREWLAVQCGTTKRTVDSWFSTRGFPPWSMKIIARLMNDTGAALEGKIVATFTTEEFEMIEQARHMVGDPPRPQFYHDSIMAYANDIIEAEEKIEPMPQSGGEDQGQRVAEDAAPYRHTKKRKPAS